ncbi:VCBS repeat-containing protein [Neolewinella persica]|uniref:VCBS repeat-containing protein n=1 Tax=Neolewinella persica TaxID=70998 RepID=UPI000376F423|nr:VCBS repeat-containing protein [Neolewinella persica]
MMYCLTYRRILPYVLLTCLPWLPLLAQPNFTELSFKQTGITFRNDLKDTPAHNILIYSNYYGGAGVGIGDFNRDGLQDIFFAGNLVNDQLYFNEGQMTFALQKKAGILKDDGWSSGVIVADVNHDGWPDIYVTRELYDDAPDRRANLLYLNDGDGTFTEAAKLCGVADEGRSRHALFFDFDGDGDLDLYVLNQPPNTGNYSPLFGTDLKAPEYRSRLYRNDGNNANGQPQFTDTGTTSGLAEVGFPNSVVAGDFNGDGNTDLYVSHDYDAPDRLYQNNGDGTFTDLIKGTTGHTSYYSMGVDAADINQDGLLDLMVLDMVAEDNYRLKANMSGMNPEAFQQVLDAGGHYQYMFNSLQLNRGKGQFSEIAQLAGVAATDWSWANLFADFNNDGRQDLYVTNGLLRDIRNTDAAKEFATYVTKKINAYILANPDDADVTIYDVIDLKEALDLIPSQPLSNYAFENEGDYQFTPRATDWGLDKPGFSNGAAYADLDNDGRLDLVVSNINAPASIYHNQGTGGSYLRLKLVDPEHKSTFGTKVKISSGGKKVQHFETTNVRGMYSTSESTVHFGLGEDAGPKNGYGAWRVEVTWPDGTKDYADDISSNFTLTMEKQGSGVVDQRISPKPLLSEITKAVALPYRHRENVFDDYRYQVLIPHKQSQNGPGVAVGDLNGDQLDDLYLGGASGQPGELLLQTAAGKFVPSSTETFRGSSLLEDVAATFFDADGDGDQDLYVVSGGNEFDAGSPFYQDRLYLNDGAGNLTAAPTGSLPPLTASGGCVAPADFDGDGDLDLFVGGRLTPRDYPAPADSYLLRNDGGNFTDVTAEMAPFLKGFGLVTAAEWTDLNSDGKPDLMVVGEWMPLAVLYNTGDRFRAETDFTDSQNPTSGWWFSLSKADLDGDGDEDFVFGNLGENYKYQATPEEPFEVFYDDFDGNGQRDIVLSYYNDGKQFPLRGRSCSAQQIPELKESFPSYDAFAGATLTEVFDPLALDKSLQLSATTFSSMVGINDGGRLKLMPLPKEAQFSAIRSAVCRDFDGDGTIDILSGGNLYQSEVETPRADAGIGLVLQGLGQGKFQAMPSSASGLAKRTDLREIRTVRTAEGLLVLMVVNDGEVGIYKIR